MMDDESAIPRGVKVQLDAMRPKPYGLAERGQAVLRLMTGSTAVR